MLGGRLGRFPASGFRLQASIFRVLDKGTLGGDAGFQGEGPRNRKPKPYCRGEEFSVKGPCAHGCPMNPTI